MKKEYKVRQVEAKIYPTRQSSNQVGFKCSGCEKTFYSTVTIPDSLCADCVIK